MANQAENEGFRMLEDFACDAIHAPGGPHADQRKKANNEGRLLVGDIAFDERNGSLTTRRNSMWFRLAMILLFLVAAVVGSLVFWWQADWWYYVQDPVRGPWPKFKAPAWEQFVVSCVVGTVCGAVVVGAVSLFRVCKLLASR
jgi:hypothetical protein